MSWRDRILHGDSLLRHVRWGWFLFWFALTVVIVAAYFSLYHTEFALFALGLTSGALVTELASVVERRNLRAENRELRRTPAIAQAIRLGQSFAMKGKGRGPGLADLLGLRKEYENAVQADSLQPETPGAKALIKGAALLRHG